MKLISKYRHLTFRLLLSLFCICYFIACQKSQPEEVFLIQEKDAEFYEIALDSMPVPLTFAMKAGSIKKVRPPKVLTFIDDGLKVSAKNTSAAKTQAITPGQDGVPPAFKTKLIPHKIKGARPQINIAKPPTFPDYNPYNFNIYDLTSGLIDSKIHDIHQDRKGNIWFSSYIGVSKYNGRTFENYSSNQGLEDGYIEDISEDKAGNIWLGHRTGLSYFDGEYMTSFKTEEDLFDHGVNQILEDRKGNLWFSTYSSGICKKEKNDDFISQYATEQKLSNTIYGVLESKDGTLWFATDDMGLIKYDGKTFRTVSLSAGLEITKVTCLTEARDGSIWFGSDGAIGRFDGTTFSTYNVGNSTVRYLLEDPSGTIWASTMYDGVFTLKNHQLKRINEQNGLPVNEASSLLLDRSGNIWIGTYEGAVKYNPMFASIYAQDGLTSKSARSLLEDRKGNIWVGCELGGVSYIDHQKNTISNYTEKNGLSGQNINSISEDREGNIWFGFWDSDICKLSPDHKTITQYKDMGHKTVSFYTDHNGDIWYSSRIKGGVIKIDKNNDKTTHVTVKQGLVDNEIIQINQDQDSNYVFTTFSGISILNKAQTHITNYPQTKNQSLSIIESCFQDHTGAYWLNSLGGDGLFRLNRKTNKIRQFTIQDGLPSNILLSAIQDDDKNMWLSSRNGLIKIDKETLESLDITSIKNKENLFMTYGAENNFPGSGDGRHHILKDMTNKIWVLLLERISLVDLNKTQNIDKDIQVELLNVKLFNEDIDWTTDSTYALKNGLKVGKFKFDALIKNTGIPDQPALPYNNNFISFEFIGIDVNKPQSVKYQHRLEGLENNWSSITTNPEATYGNLASGKYVFKVKAMNEAGLWSKESQYEFSITPPWWKTWWAYFIYGLLALLLIYAWTRYNVYLTLEKYKATEAMRVKISSDLHDDVGSILSGLSMKSELMSYSAEKNQQLDLNAISEMSRDAMERMRDTVWAMDSRKDKYENLIDRMKAFAETNLSMKEITYDFKVEKLKTNEFISPEIRQNLYFIFKEAITNILKHSNASHVTVSFNKRRNNLALSIHDNGTQKKAKIGDGLGMSNIKNRTDKMRGIYSISYTNGFLVEVTVPIH